MVLKPLKNNIKTIKTETRKPYRCNKINLKTIENNKNTIQTNNNTNQF